MSQSDVEPADSGWDEHKPEVNPADAALGGKRGRIFAWAWFGLAAGSLVLQLVAWLLNFLKLWDDDNGLGVWCFGASLILVEVCVLSVTLFVQRQRNRPAFKIAAWGLLMCGAHILVTVGFFLYIVSHISWC